MAADSALHRQLQKQMQRSQSRIICSSQIYQLKGSHFILLRTKKVTYKCTVKLFYSFYASVIFKGINITAVDNYMLMLFTVMGCIPIHTLLHYTVWWYTKNLYNYSLDKLLNVDAGLQTSCMSITHHSLNRIFFHFHDLSSFTLRGMTDKLKWLVCNLVTIDYWLV